MLFFFYISHRFYHDNFMNADEVLINWTKEYKCDKPIRILAFAMLKAQSL